MRDEKRYVLGKVNYNHYKSGRRNCEVAITWTLAEGRFSMCAEVWNPRKTNLYMYGQCVDTVAAMFPNDTKAQRMAEVWKRYHLNDMKAGSAVQEQWLRDNPIPEAEYAYPRSHYKVASDKLADAGLNPDPNGYLYGHEWKAEELPAAIVAEIESWG